MSYCGIGGSLPYAIYNAKNPALYLIHGSHKFNWSQPLGTRSDRANFTRIR